MKCTESILCLTFCKTRKDVFEPYRQHTPCSPESASSSSQQAHPSSHQVISYLRHFSSPRPFSYHHQSPFLQFSSVFTTKGSFLIPIAIILNTASRFTSVAMIQPSLHNKNVLPNPSGHHPQYRLEVLLRHHSLLHENFTIPPLRCPLHHDLFYRFRYAFAALPAQPIDRVG